jgi:hypothetical protein
MSDTFYSKLGGNGGYGAVASGSSDDPFPNTSDPAGVADHGLPGSVDSDPSGFGGGNTSQDQPDAADNTAYGSIHVPV